MQYPIYQVDAFTGRVFGGNPAAVVLLNEWLPDETLQAIAAENNLSETAFLIFGKYVHSLRWFTPKLEVDLCGHATLATAFVLFESGAVDGESVRFETKSGVLTVRKQGELYAMDFPARAPRPVSCTDEIVEALGRRPKDVRAARALMAVFEDEDEVRGLAPDFARLSAVHDFAVIVTAPGREVDFVSRFFAPNAGIPEDPVTGSAHCTLVPYWSKRLEKPKLHALQVSARGGELFCEDRGERVTMAGRAVSYMEGSITI